MLFYPWFHYSSVQAYASLHTIDWNDKKKNINMPFNTSEENNQTNLIQIIDTCTNISCIVDICT